MAIRPNYYTIEYDAEIGTGAAMLAAIIKTGGNRYFPRCLRTLQDEDATRIAIMLSGDNKINWSKKGATFTIKFFPDGTVDATRLDRKHEWDPVEKKSRSYYDRTTITLVGEDAKKVYKIFDYDIEAGRQGVS